MHKTSVEEKLSEGEIKARYAKTFNLIWLL